MCDLYSGKYGKFCFFIFTTLSLPLLLHIFFILDVGFEIPDEFVVGYALDYNEFFRDLNVSAT